jgi:GNAT superfamily N-acetyltransferase
MLQPSLELVCRIEAADARLGLALVRAFEALFPQEFASYLELGGGALYAVGGRTPVTQVVGMGLGGAVSERDLERLIELLDEHRLSAEVQVSGFAEPTLVPRLLDRGFLLVGSEQTLAREVLTSDREHRPSGAFSIHGMHPREAELWARTAATGFAAQGTQPTPAAEAPPGALDAMLATTAADGFLGFFVRLGNEVIGAGGMLCAGDVASLFGHVTLAQFRRRGVQRALVAHSLAVASERGIELLKINTLAQTTSLRNAERVGFQHVDLRRVFLRAVTQAPG